MNKTVVSFADGNGNYIKQMARLGISLTQTGFNGNFKAINDYGHIRSKLHSEVPYQFKPYAIQNAREECGGLILWCDSPVYAKKSIQPVFDHIKEHGYVFFDNIGYSVGDYTSDQCIAHFGVSREESFSIPMIMACVMGFDFDNLKAVEMFDEYIKLASEETTYKGAWSNNNCEVSADMRVKGHRHDQSVMSLILYKHGIKPIKAQDTFFAYETHRQVMTIAASVCLYSQGI